VCSGRATSESRRGRGTLRSEASWPVDDAVPERLEDPGCVRGVFGATSPASATTVRARDADGPALRAKSAAECSGLASERDRRGVESAAAPGGAVAVRRAAACRTARRLGPASDIVGTRVMLVQRRRRTKSGVAVTPESRGPKQRAGVGGVRRAQRDDEGVDEEREGASQQLHLGTRRGGAAQLRLSASSGACSHAHHRGAAGSAGNAPPSHQAQRLR
jgi:hypothetical protein